MPPAFYFTYRVGAVLLGRHPGPLHFTFTLDAILDNLESIWQPLLLGSLVCGLVFGVIGYATVRLFWRWHVVQHLKRRREDRLAKKPLSRSA